MITVKKVWEVIAAVLLGLLVVTVVLLVSIRICGIMPFSVLSGSMSPTYETGDLIFVKETTPENIEVDDVITYMASEDTIITHRVIGIVPSAEDPSVIRYKTMGDANNIADDILVHYKNVIGEPVFSIPKLGYAAVFIQSRAGKAACIGILGLLAVSIILPDVFALGRKKDDGSPDNA